ncbi:GNAT family N-acetyltransferase [Phenylobacterium sp.]|uniref:GNAT family N-acetyltransferase n=1 Tax=Phenylobacterium sp. TaxID=1871053 RepID=UPI0025D07C0B|nr:GNAT family N-acetyltransferase [Phenylobacterium sp.]
MSLKIVRAARSDSALLQNLFQLYTHDFSEFWAGSARGELEADGRYTDYPLTPFFERASWSAWLLKSGEAPAGFALINDAAHSGLPTRRSMAEFFVVRKHRGQGAGRAAAQALIADEPGGWEIAVARANTGALTFWRKVAATCAAGPVEELDIASPDWNGPVLRFAAR